MRNRSISPTFVSVIFLLTSASQGIASTRMPDLLEGPTTKQQTSPAEFLYKDYVNGFSAGLGRLNVAPEVADEIEDSLKKRRTEPHPPQVAASSCDGTMPVWSIRPQMPSSELDVCKIDFLTAQAILWESTLVNSLSLQKSGWDAHQNVLRFSEAVQTSSKYATALENPKTKKLAEMMGSSVGDGTLMHLMVGSKERESHWLKHYDAEQKRPDAYRYRTYDPHYFAKSDWMFADRRFKQSYLKFFEEHPELDGCHARFEWVREVKFQIMALKQWRALTSHSYKNTTYLRRARFDAADVAVLDCGLQFPLTKFSESSRHPDERMVWALSQNKNTYMFYYVSGEEGSDQYGNITVSVLRKGYSQNVRWKPTDPHANYGDQSEFYQRRDHFNVSNGPANNPDPGVVFPAGVGGNYRRGYFDPIASKIDPRSIQLHAYHSAVLKGYLTFSRWGEVSESELGLAKPSHQVKQYRRGSHFNVASQQKADPGFKMPSGKVSSSKAPAKILVERHDLKSKG